MTGLGLLVRAYLLVNLVAALVIIDEANKRNEDPEEFTISLLKELIEFLGFH